MFLGIDTSSFMPHGHCVLWAPQILIPMVLAETLTVVAYMFIPVGLFQFMQKRKDLTENVKNILWLFIAFIFFCGVSHFVSTWNYWNSNYILETSIKVLTGFFSFATLIIVYRNIDKLLAIPSPTQYKKLNEELQELNNQLEERIEIRNEELKDQLLKNESILKGVSDGILKYIPVYNEKKEVIDFKSKVLNNSALKILSVQHRSDLETDSMVIKFPGMKKNGHWEQCIKALTSGETVTIDPQYQEDLKRFYRVSVSKMEKSDKLLVFFSDVTEREDLKMDLVSSAKLAALGELAGGIAHEINTPLQIAEGLIRKSKREIPEDLKAHEALDLLKENKDEISNIVKNLKRLSRGDKSDNTEILLSDVVENLQNMFTARLQQRNIEFICEKPSDDIKVFGNEVSMTQILNNLINNSVDAIEESSQNNRKINVVTAVEGENISLRVKDSGPGIPEEIKGRIFDPLYTTKPVGDGTGLGLSISKRLAESMNGELNLIRSDQTEFELRLKKA